MSDNNITNSPTVVNHQPSTTESTEKLPQNILSETALHQPHSIDLEKSVLASLMSLEESFERISDSINEKDFYAQRHQLIFSAIRHLADSNEPYDVVMVSDWLESQKLLKTAGDTDYLAEILSQSPATLFNLSAYAQRVREFSVLRQVIKAGNHMLNLAYDPKGQSVSDILDVAESEIFAINEQYTRTAQSKGPTRINAVITNVMDTIQTLKARPDGLIGLQTPFLELNNKTQGLQRGDLIIVAARPSMGKTTFAMNLAEGILNHTDLPVVVFSMEMPAESIIMRLLSSWGGINQGHLRSGQMSEHEWSMLTTAITHLHNKKLYVDDSTALPPSEVRSRCRRIAKDHDGKLGMVLVDYLQLMKVPSLDGNRVGEISEISRSLKALAREMNCPVVALSQLNRSLENRPNKRPIMSDLRESGAIEQDADLIMFIYRDEVYNEKSEQKGVAEIIIGKQRNGPIGTVRLGFQGQFTRFVNLTPEMYQGETYSDADE
ncbi:replicative DNA helicase [Faucicola boevrei]|uniref:replicative DNA helicase n=1 Tax=Faucicola boevrei TaxID=346665 RepID=UPI0003828FEF|nr:replicative DNA helicase [Moraxella boevrei]